MPTKKIAKKKQAAQIAAPEPKQPEHIVSTLVRVKLTIGGNSSGQVKAKELARESAAAHGADEASITSAVKWLPKEYRSLLGGAASALRTGFNSRTLPWEDGGFRVIPADRYNDLQGFISEFRQTFDEAVTKIGDNWDAILADAKKRLNGALKLVTLPSREQFLAGFRVDMDSSCVVAPSDIRIMGLDEVAISRIREQNAKEYGARIEAGVQQLVAQLSELLTDLASRNEKDEQKGIRYDGWAKWAKKTVATVRPLNITKNRALDALLAQVESIAASIDPKALRDSAAARLEIRKKAKATAPADDALASFGT